MAEEVLRLGIDPRGAVRGSQQFSKATAGAAAAASGLDGAVLRTTGTFGLMAAAAVGATVALGRFAEAGGKQLTVQSAFKKRVGDTEAALNGLRRATSGLIDDYTLMEQANTALTLGSARTVGEFGELAEVAQALGRALGLDAAFALQSLNTGIARQSRLILDNLGLIVDQKQANERYAASIGRTVSQLSDAERAEAFRIEAMEQARAKMAEMGDVTLNAGDAYAQLMVEVKNTTDELKKLVAESDAVEGFFDGLVTTLRVATYEMGRFAEKQGEAIRQAGMGGGEAMAAMFGRGRSGDTRDLTRELLESGPLKDFDPAEFERAVEPITASVERMRTELALSVDNLGLLEGAADSLESKIEDTRLALWLEDGAEEAQKLQDELDGLIDRLERINTEITRQRLNPGAGGITGPAGTGRDGRFGSRAALGRAGVGLPQYQGGFGADDLFVQGIPEPLAPGLEDTADGLDQIAQASRVAAPLLGDFGSSMSTIASGIAAGGFVGIGTAVVSALGSIVGGLFDSGLEAQRAARQWEIALDDFANAFSQDTALAEGLRSANRWFRDQTEGLAGTYGVFETQLATGSIEELRALADALQGAAGRFGKLGAELDALLESYDQHTKGLGESLREQEGMFAEDLEVRLLRAQGLEEEADALALALKQERELAEAREIGYGEDTIRALQEVHAAERERLNALEDERDLLNSVTSALNGPQGLNLALLSYRASLEGQVPTRDRGIDGTAFLPGRREGAATYHTTNTVTINVDGSGDPRRVAREVWREAERESRRGGASPTETTRR